MKASSFVLVSIVVIGIVAFAVVSNVIAYQQVSRVSAWYKMINFTVSLPQFDVYRPTLIGYPGIGVFVSSEYYFGEGTGTYEYVFTDSYFRPLPYITSLYADYIVFLPDKNVTNIYMLYGNPFGVRVPVENVTVGWVVYGSNANLGVSLADGTSMYFYHRECTRVALAFYVKVPPEVFEKGTPQIRIGYGFGLGSNSTILYHKVFRDRIPLEYFNISRFDVDNVVALTAQYGIFNGTPGVEYVTGFAWNVPSPGWYTILVITKPVNGTCAVTHMFPKYVAVYNGDGSLFAKYSDYYYILEFSYGIDSIDPLGIPQGHYVPAIDGYFATGSYVYNVSLIALPPTVVRFNGNYWVVRRANVSATAPDYALATIYVLRPTTTTYKFQVGVVDVVATFPATTVTINNQEVVLPATTVTTKVPLFGVAPLECNTYDFVTVLNLSVVKPVGAVNLLEPVTFRTATISTAVQVVPVVSKETVTSTVEVKPKLPIDIIIALVALLVLLSAIVVAFKYRFA